MKLGQQQMSFLGLILVTLVLGIVVSKFFAIVLGKELVIILGLVLFLCLYTIFKQANWTWLVVAILFLLVGIMRFSAVSILSPDNIANCYGQEVTVKGVLREAPRASEASDGKVQLRYVVDVKQLKNGGNDWQKASGGVYISAHVTPAEVVEAKIGDIITATGKVKQPHGYQNPGQIDIAQLLASQDINAMLSTGKKGVTVTATDSEHFKRQIEAIRESYLSNMQQVMPKSDAAAIFAMLFGGYDGIKPDLLEAFTITGIVHILSVSGSHISLLAATMAYLAYLLRLPVLGSSMLVIGAIVIYSALAGFVPPVIRSAVMGGLVFLAVALKRESDSRRILLLTGLVMLIYDPRLLYNISFELSFLATAGLLFMAPGINKYLQAKRVPKFVAMSVAITLAAQLTTLPILAWYFNQLSLSSLIANLVVVPVVEFMIMVGLLGGLIAVVVPLLGKFIFVFDSLLLGFVYEVTRLIANLPASQIWFPTFNWLMAIFYYAALGLWCWPTGRKYCLKYRQKIIILLLVVLTSLTVWQLTRPQEMTVHFIDVGQGDAALVITPHHKAFMIDTGGTRDNNFDIGARVVVPYLRHYGILELEAIFLTHTHEDHAAACGSILQKMPVKAVYTADEGLIAYARSMKLSDNAPQLAKLRAIKQGAELIVDGVKIEVIFAPPLDKGSLVTGNEASNVYRVSYGKASFLFTGDLTAEKEKTLLAAGINPQSTVLKVGHHGSNTSSSLEFLQAVQPKQAVFCVGLNNSFGHPKPEVVKRYQDQGITIWRTDQNGAILFYTDGQKMQVKPYVTR